jgi:hypothetical protein
VSNIPTYSIISTGKIQDDFGLAEVQANFAKLFKTTAEHAAAYLGVEKVINKEVGLEEAQTIKTRLEAIGMMVELRENKPLDFSIDSLSLVEKEPTKEENSMTCPKCDLRQEKAEQCTACGVYVNKLISPSP